MLISVLTDTVIKLELFGKMSTNTAMLIKDRCVDSLVPLTSSNAQYICYFLYLFCFKRYFNCEQSKIYLSSDLFDTKT